jgi:hypothetical protein
MRVAELRKEGVAQLDQAFEEARRWVFETWPEDDWQDIAHAIRDGVNAECLLRDNREHQIPLDGKIHDEDTELDPATGKTKLRPIEIDPMRQGLRHGHREVRLEGRRRLHALTLRRPEPSTFFELHQAIQEDDGKDADGRWLCNRRASEKDRRSEAYPDGTGFDSRLPKWMPPMPSAAVASSVSAPVQTASPVPEPAPVVTPTDSAPVISPNGCPECGGQKIGRGYRHAAGCSKPKPV